LFLYYNICCGIDGLERHRNEEKKMFMSVQAPLEKCSICNHEGGFII
jgi:hypothetical protein